jgi:hypothetical protein
MSSFFEISLSLIMPRADAAGDKNVCGEKRKKTVD